MKKKGRRKQYFYWRSGGVLKTLRKQRKIRLKIIIARAKLPFGERHWRKIESGEFTLSRRQMIDVMAQSLFEKNAAVISFTLNLKYEDDLSDEEIEEYKLDTTSSEIPEALMLFAPAPAKKQPAAVYNLTARGFASSVHKKRIEREVNNWMKAMDRLRYGVCAYTAERKALIWNTAAEGILGWKAAEVLHKQLPFTAIEDWRTFDYDSDPLQVLKVRLDKKDGSQIQAETITASMRTRQDNASPKIYLSLIRDSRTKHGLKAGEASDFIESFYRSMGCMQLLAAYLRLEDPEYSRAPIEVRETNGAEDGGSIAKYLSTAKGMHNSLSSMLVTLSKTVRKYTE